VLNSLVLPAAVRASPSSQTIPGAAADRKAAPVRRMGGPAPRAMPQQQPRQQQQQPQPQYRPAPVPSGDQVWQRDMYREEERPVRRQAAVAPRQAAGTKL
jgi:hypothetical protein